MTDRKGNWMQTIGGRAFYPLDPRPEDVDIEDIAHALSHVCRFGGHCISFYSVAEHCVRVSEAIEAAGGSVAEQFEGLMHDSAEAYVGDMVWPLKQAEDVAGYKRVEKLVEAAIAKRFGLPHEQSPIVKKFDLVLLSTEKRDLMMDGVGREDGSKRESAAAKAKLGAWHCDEFKALPDWIESWMPTTARLRFLDRFRKLTEPGRERPLKETHGNHEEGDDGRGRGDAGGAIRAVREDLRHPNVGADADRDGGAVHEGDREASEASQGVTDARNACAALAEEHLFREVMILRSAVENHDSMVDARAEVAEQMGLLETDPKTPRVEGAAAKLDDYQLVMSLICNARCPQHAHVPRTEVIPEIERRLAARNVAMQCVACGSATTPASTVTLGTSSDRPRIEIGDHVLVRAIVTDFGSAHGLPDALQVVTAKAHRLVSPPKTWVPTEDVLSLPDADRRVDALTEFRRTHDSEDREISARRPSHELRGTRFAKSSGRKLGDAVDETPLGVCIRCDAILNAEDVEDRASLPPVPVPMFLTCPKCNARHIDEGDFATKSHHTHSCQSCGLTWRPAVGPTVGVAFLPGFKNEPVSDSSGSADPRRDSYQSDASEAEVAALRTLAAAVGQLVRANDPSGNENPRPDIAWRDVRAAYEAVKP